jgi:hypothetical protein
MNDSEMLGPVTVFCDITDGHVLHPTEAMITVCVTPSKMLIGMVWWGEFPCFPSLFRSTMSV